MIDDVASGVEPEHNHDTRESWLQALVALLRPVFERHGAAIPAVAISVGFPKGARGSKNGSHAIGQCWHPDASADHKPAVFVHPELSDPIRIGACVIHEMVHAAGNYNHGRDFGRLARALGLEGKLTATTPSDLTRDMLQRMTATLGVYPHGALDSSIPTKKQTTRMLKAECAWDHEPYIVRLSATTAARGLPRCGECGGAMALDSGD